MSSGFLRLEAKESSTSRFGYTPGARPPTKVPGREDQASSTRGGWNDRTNTEMGALRADAVSRPSDRVRARFRTPSGDDALPDAFHGADHCHDLPRPPVLGASPAPATTTRGRRPDATRPATSTPPSAAPTFLLIGAMKAGTTSLYQYLGAHPQVATTQYKAPSSSWRSRTGTVVSTGTASSSWRSTRTYLLSAKPERVREVPAPRRTGAYRRAPPASAPVYAARPDRADPLPLPDQGRRGEREGSLLRCCFRQSHLSRLQPLRHADRAVPRTFSREQLLVITSEDLRHPAKRRCSASTDLSAWTRIRAGRTGARLLSDEGPRRIPGPAPAEEFRSVGSRRPGASKN